MKNEKCGICGTKMKKSGENWYCPKCKIYVRFATKEEIKEELEKEAEKKNIKDELKDEEELKNYGI